MRHKWHIRKGYLKIHVAVDIRKFEDTSEEVHDGQVLKKLVDHTLEKNKVKKALGDGSYDSNSNFRCLSKNHIQAGIKTRRNSKVRPTNCKPRNMAVLRQQRNPKRWKHSVSFGQRWMAEIVFSSMKRMFGEHVLSMKFPNMVKEMVSVIKRLFGEHISSRQVRTQNRELSFRCIAYNMYRLTNLVIVVMIST